MIPVGKNITGVKRVTKSVDVRETPIEKADRRTKLRFCITIGLVFMITISFCCLKGKIFFIDEVWSYGLSNSQYAPWLTDVKGELVDQVYSRQDLFDYVTVNRSDSFDYASVYYNQTQDVHPPLFYWLFHTVSSLFPNSFSKWIGLVPNLCMYLLTLLLLYLCVIRLFRSWNNAIFTVLLYGLSTLGISSVLMLRMYMMMTLFTVLLAYLIIRLLQAEKWYLYPAITATVFAGLMTQYYYVFYAFFVCVATDIVLLYKKKWRAFALFSTFAIVGVLLMYLAYPACINHLMSGEKVSGSGIIENLTAVKGLIKGVLIFIKRTIVIAITAFAGFAIWIYQHISKSKRPTGWFRCDVAAIVLPAYISLLTIMIVTSDGFRVRYLYSVCPIVALTASFAISLVDKKAISVNTKRLAAIGMTIVAIIAVFVVKPEWLDRDVDAYGGFTSQHSKDACVYLVKDSYSHDAITVDIPQLLAFSETFVTDDIQKIPKYLETKDSQEEVVLYIAHQTSLYHEYEQVDKAVASIGYETCDLIRSYSAADLYLLTK